MFEIGWTEMLVIAVVMIVVVGPKDLPGMLRSFGRTSAKLRSMAGDFQKQFNEALKEAELEDVKKSVDTLRSLNPAAEIRKQLNPFEKAAADVRAGLDTAMKPAPAKAAAPAAFAPQAVDASAPATLAAVPGPQATPPAPAIAAPPVEPAPPAPVPPAVGTPASSLPPELVPLPRVSAPKAKRVTKPRVSVKKPAETTP